MAPTIATSFSVCSRILTGIKEQIVLTKINKATEILNDTTEQSDLIDICRTLHPKITRLLCIHFKGTWNILKGRSQTKTYNKLKKM